MEKSVEIPESNLEGFEPPYHAAAMPITLDGGSEVMIAGVVDPTLVSEYDNRLNSSEHK